MFLTRHQPNRLFDQLSDDLFRVFDRPSLATVNRARLPNASTSNNTANAIQQQSVSDWMPQVDIIEEKNQYLILIDVPGVDPKAIEITTDKNILTISGQRQSVEKTDDKAFQRVERKRGSFSRRFTMPEDVNINKISAKGKDGVLEVVVPKGEQLLPRKINVNA